MLIALMYLPWIAYFLRSRPAPGEDSDMMFPGGIVFVVLFFGYLIVALALSIRLYLRHKDSVFHGIAFYGSLGILALISILFMTS